MIFGALTILALLYVIIYVGYTYFTFIKIRNFILSIIFGFLPIFLGWLIFLFKDDYISLEILVFPSIISLCFGMIRIFKKEKKSVSEINKMKIDDL
ncbi:MAG: hypothetical protein PHC62_02740 [Candidatus Izemoplasmatales bacterium]|jgi:hypothetical protein|nr:hypothetical protein [Candidatus Izemoplasmatales bacterium]